MNLNIPPQFRQEFDRSADFAIEKESFTPSELAAYLDRGVLVASIMVGYMEKAELVTRGKGEDVRHARITLAEWEAIDKKIENYEPVPEPEPEPEPIPIPEPELTVADIITHKLNFIGKVLTAESSLVVLEDGEGRTDIKLDSISTLYLHRGKWFGRNTLTFSSDGEVPHRTKQRRDTVAFKKRDWEKVRGLAEAIAERLEIEVKLY